MGGDADHLDWLDGIFPRRAFSCRSTVMIDTGNAFSERCEPFTEVPAWWCGFLFHVLNARQITLYMYLNMLADSLGVCSPTARQIRQDLGLASLTIVFESLSVLETRGFILRERRAVPGLPSRRNVYQRPSCEYTIVRLIEGDHIDGSLCPKGRVLRDMSVESRRLKDQWLKRTLGHSYDRYNSVSVEMQGAMLLESLRERLGASPTDDSCA